MKLDNMMSVICFDGPSDDDGIYILFAKLLKISD
jgi:hypothetical protein